jgi:hypothetical protein
MKTVTEKKPQVRIITETVRLDACRALDRVDIRHSEKGRFGTIGSVQLDKVKTIPNGKIQIKYHSTWGTKPKVLKADLPGDLIVERRREATEADGPDAGVPEVRTATHEGVPYRAIDPEDDVDALLIAAVQTGMGEGRTITSTLDLMEAISIRIGGSSVLGIGSSLAEDLGGGIDGRHRAMARSLVAKVGSVGGDPGSKHDRRDPDMERMGGWLGALEDHGVLQPGAKERLMGSVWTEQELSDGRPKPGSVVIDG